MEPTSIRNIHAHLAAGSEVAGLSGRIIFAGEQKPTRTKGTMQYIVLAEPDGERDEKDTTLPATLFDQPLIKDEHLQTDIYLAASHTEKGWHGVKVDEYQGKLCLKVSGKATIQYYDASGQTEPQPARPAAPAPPAAAPPPPRQQAPPPARPTAPDKTDKNATVLAKQFFGRCGTVESLALDAAVHTAFNFHGRHGVAMGPQTVFMMADKFLIAADKAGVLRDPLLPYDPYAICPFKGRPLAELEKLYEQKMDDIQRRRKSIEDAPAGTPIVEQPRREWAADSDLPPPQPPPPAPLPAAPVKLGRPDGPPPPAAALALDGGQDAEDDLPF